MIMNLFRSGFGAGPRPSLSLFAIAVILVGSSELVAPQTSLAAPRRSSNSRPQSRPQGGNNNSGSSSTGSTESSTPSSTPSGSSATAPATPPVITAPSAPNPNGFTLSGLLSTATVSNSIFVSTSGLPTNATISYFVDNVLQSTENASPYWMGGISGSAPNGFSVNGFSVGEHNLTATATLANGTTISSNLVTLNVVPSINAQFSQDLTPYANQPSAQQSTVPQVTAAVANQAVTLSSTDSSTRQSVAAMYLNWGIDPSLDSANDDSQVLANLKPKSWQAPSAPVSANSPISMAFSPDSPYYHAIPSAWPRVGLPAAYIQQVQMSSAYGGDGIGFGVTIAAPSDPQLTVTSEWYTDKNTLNTFPFRMKQNWTSSLPSNAGGDQHMLFVDPGTDTFVSSYATTLNQQTGGPNSLYAPSPTSFNSLGDTGGSVAAHFAEVPLMIQPGEATNTSQPIRHAIGGAVERTWAARVYPAAARDAGVTTGENTCNGSGPMNTGLVPYGGVIQLDPNLDLSKLTLSLPARRILEAMQTYGYYVMDFGCGDMDIYSSMSASEVDPYGGMYGNAKGPGVQNEIIKVIASSQLYVVAPLVKKQ